MKRYLEIQKNYHEMKISSIDSMVNTIKENIKEEDGKVKEDTIQTISTEEKPNMEKLNDKSSEEIIKKIQILFTWLSKKMNVEKITKFSLPSEEKIQKIYFLINDSCENVMDLSSDYTLEIFYTLRRFFWEMKDSIIHSFIYNKNIENITTIWIENNLLNNISSENWIILRRLCCEILPNCSDNKDFFINLLAPSILFYSDDFLKISKQEIAFTTKILNFLIINKNKYKNLDIETKENKQLPLDEQEDEIAIVSEPKEEKFEETENLVEENLICEEKLIDKIENIHDKKEEQENIDKYKKVKLNYSEKLFHLITEQFSLPSVYSLINIHEWMDVTFSLVKLKHETKIEPFTLHLLLKNLLHASQNFFPKIGSFASLLPKEERKLVLLNGKKLQNNIQSFITFYEPLKNFQIFHRSEFSKSVDEFLNCIFKLFQQTQEAKFYHIISTSKSTFKYLNEYIKTHEIKPSKKLVLYCLKVNFISFLLDFY